jgi:hypothetical protein
MSKKKQLRRVTIFDRKKLDLRSYKAENLVKWLNVPKDHPQWGAMKRVANLIADLREINSIAENQDAEDHDESTKARGYALSAEILKLIRPLRRSQWRLIPTLRNRKGRLVGWHLELSSGADLGRVLLQVAELSRDGLLDWVRQCHCGRWFLGYTSRSKYHSPECKEAFESAQRKTPEGRAARAKYMREHRGTLKKLEQKRKRQ